ncbi:IclR family transcriptional regulator [Pseudonocardia nematodicida]|uniref:IclR family transcriptional regulator n=1 Tax=Pseudonocardia nematodicida TaxID=1206997 RepID=A0ABV1K5W0_9PSEU
MTTPQSSEEVHGPVPPQYPIESVDNALKLLLLFEERPRVRLKEAAEYLGVASSTAHRLLAMLQFRGFVVQESGTRAYAPGRSLTVLAAAAARQIDARAQARPFLERLNLRLQETTALGRLEGTSLRYVDSIEGGRALRVGSRTGVSMPAHCAASGKAVLSGLSDDVVVALYPDEVLQKVNEHSIGTRTDLLAELAVVRDRGYALSRQETEDGVVGIAVPVSGVGDSRYALSVATPIHRATEETVALAVELLREAATELGDSLI